MIARRVARAASSHTVHLRMQGLWAGVLPAILAWSALSPAAARPQAEPPLRANQAVPPLLSRPPASAPPADDAALPATQPRSLAAPQDAATAASQERERRQALGRGAGGGTALRAPQPQGAQGPAAAADDAGWRGWLSPGGDLLKTVLPLGAVLLLAVVIKSLAARGRGAGPRPSGVVEVLARYPLGRGRQVVLLKVGRRILVAHEADRSLRTMAEVSQPEEVAELLAAVGEGRSRGFANLLERASRDDTLFRDAELVDLTRAPARAAGGRS